MGNRPAPRSRAAPVTAAVLLVAACSGAEPPEATQSPPTGSPQTSSETPSPTATTPSGGTNDHPADESNEPDTLQEPQVITSNLQVPWGLAFLPDGSALVTLRDAAEVLHIVPGQEPVSLGTVPGVVPGGEGGLMGIAVSPEDQTEVFVYLAAAEDNRVLRMRLEDGALTAEEPILTGIPRASFHNGGRIAFGPDGYLYVATGDAGAAGTSQDPESLGGKILRVDRDGEAAPGNPEEGSPVWSLGHRNVQGLGWDGAGRMYASEFGQDTWDELNRIEPGNNYGWPQVEGRADVDGFTDPLRQWRPAEASPSGIAVTDDAIYLAALRGQSLWRVPLDDGETGEPARHLQGEYGRLRTVAEDADGDLWVITNNTYRGDPGPDDDQILLIDPDWLG